MTQPNPLEQFAHATIENLRSASQQVSKTTQELQEGAHDFVEQGTENLGRIVTPLAEHPMMGNVTRLPMFRWFATAVGQVDATKVQQEVDTLRSQHVQKTRSELVQQVIWDATLKAAGVGLVTNVLPPVAAALFAVDIGVLTALQADMVYRIAAIYDLPLSDPSRRGEVFAIYGLSLGGSSLIKFGLAIPELIPGVGAILGVSSNAALLFTLGQAAAQFYETKHQKAVQKAAQNGTGA